MKFFNQDDVFQSGKTYGSFPKQEQRSFIFSFFALSAYHHQRNVAVFFFPFQNLNQNNLAN